MTLSAAAFARRHGESIGFLLIYSALFGTWNLLGGSFHVWPDLWQLLPWPPLFRDLAGALLDLHSQPPLLNLLFGVALKVSAAAGIRVELLLQPLYFVLGAATVLATATAGKRIVPRAWVRRWLLLVLILNPYLYASLHYLFYTPWELLLLSLAALFSIRYFDRPTALRFPLALAAPVLLVYTRSLFHPAWFVLQLCLVVWLGRPSAAGWRKTLAISAIAAAVIAAWPLKNLVRFGFFGYSSWSGMSIARGLPTGDPVVASSYPKRLAAFARASSHPPDPAAAAAAQRLVPANFVRRPTLSDLSKPDGSPNWNHYALIPLSREVGAAAMARVRENPSLLLFKALDFYLNGYAIYEARWPYDRRFSSEMTVGERWAKVYEVIVFQRFRPYDPDQTGASTGFAILFPILIAAAAFALWKRGPWRPEDRTVAMMLYTVLWVLAMVVLVDGPEGNRVRFCTEPYLLLIVGWVVAVLLGLRRPKCEFRIRE